MPAIEGDGNCPFPSPLQAKVNIIMGTLNAIFYFILLIYFFKCVYIKKIKTKLVMKINIQYVVLN